MSSASETSSTGNNEDKDSVTNGLADIGYRPARAAFALQKGEFSRAVELCLEHLTEKQEGLSARLIYSRALYHTGQFESAVDQFHLVLRDDPDNIVALKYLGDLKFAKGDTFGAFADYERIQILDPMNESLCCNIDENRNLQKGSITLVRASGEKSEQTSVSSRLVPFYTETLGDLYFAQGHSRLAVEVFARLNQAGDNPRLAQKLSEAQAKIHDKER